MAEQKHGSIRKAEAAQRMEQTGGALDAYEAGLSKAPSAIKDAVTKNRMPGLDALLKDSNRLRDKSYTGFYQDLAGVDAGSINPMAAFAKAMGNSLFSYNQLQNNRARREAYGGDTKELAAMALQAYMMGYQGLQNKYNRDATLEQNLAQRLHQGDQLAETRKQNSLLDLYRNNTLGLQRDQFNWGKDMDLEDLALRKRADARAGAQKPGTDWETIKAYIEQMFGGGTNNNTNTTTYKPSTPIPTRNTPGKSYGRGGGAF